MTTLLWLRRDLRRHDLPALLAAAEATDDDVAVIFVVDPRLWEGAGAARRAWLAASVHAAREAYDGKLALLYGDPVTVVPEVAERVGATSVHVSRETTPAGARRDRRVAKALADRDVEWVETGTPYAVGPGTIVNKSGEGFKVFTPFARAWRDHGRPAPADDVTVDLRGIRNDAQATAALDDALKAADLPDLPAAGEDAARARWADFLDEALTDYATDRDRPDRRGTSGMSPYLKVGAIHPRTLLADLGGRRGDGAETFATELAWREFYADVLWRAPRSAWHDLTTSLQGMSYDDPDDHADAVEAWRSGTTGFPFVDAAMRQLLATGWMHNRARMVTASFLTKDLHVWWPVGARHFLDHLIDGDIASNNHGWQWVAGTGTDASPYFRVFNPVTQGLKFDPDGSYVRRWIPELRHLDGKAAHEPWKHDDGHAHGYPEPIVDHAHERQDALDRYQRARG